MRCVPWAVMLCGMQVLPDLHSPATRQLAVDSVSGEPVALYLFVSTTNAATLQSVLSRCSLVSVLCSADSRPCTGAQCTTSQLLAVAATGPSTVLTLDSSADQAPTCAGQLAGPCGVPGRSQGLCQGGLPQVSRGFTCHHLGLPYTGCMPQSGSLLWPLQAQPCLVRTSQTCTRVRCTLSLTRAVWAQRPAELWAAALLLPRLAACPGP